MATTAQPQHRPTLYRAIRAGYYIREDRAAEVIKRDTFWVVTVRDGSEEIGAADVCNTLADALVSMLAFKPVRPLTAENDPWASAALAPYWAAAKRFYK